MKSITTQLFETAQGMITLQKEVSDPTGKYHMADDGGVESETGEFFYGLIKLLKPEKVLTTGVYTGVSDMYIAEALKDNGFGKSTALEYEDHHLRRAERLWRIVGVADYINGVLTSSLDFQPQELYEFIFLDTEPEIRYQELVKFFPFLKEGGYIFIHDCPRNMCQGNVNPDHPEIKSWPFGPIPKDMEDHLKTGRLVKFHLPAPRGLVGFYKPKPEDLKI